MEERRDIEGTAATNGHSEGTMVLAGTEARAIEPVHSSPLPAPVVAAAGGALAGALAFVMLRALRRAPHSAAVRLRRRRRRGAFEITGSRSFLVDVHMIKR
jgi:hypothetical protein